MRMPFARWTGPLCLATLLLAACGGGGGEPLPEACSATLPVSSSTTRPDGWSTASHAKSAAPDYPLVFPAASVLRMDISLAACDWQNMLADLAVRTGVPPRASRASVGNTTPVGCSATVNIPSGEYVSGTPIWAPVTLRFQGQTWNHVGMRFKGSSTLLRSWQAGLYKLPFRLHFDRFEDSYEPIRDQRFFGFQKLSFGNHVADPSFLREKVTSDLLREYGVPAARTAWVRVYLDLGAGARYLGLYTMTEIPANPMLQAQFGNKDGNLYKPEGDGANWGPRNLVSADTFNQSFEKQSNEDAGDWSDIQTAVDALNADSRTGATSAWRTGLEQAFNVNAFLKWKSANAVLGNGDAYGFIAQNYYLYGDALDAVPGRLNWIPWDHDRALSCGALDIRYPAPGYPATRWPLTRYLLDDALYGPAYLQHARNFLASGQFDEGSLRSRLDAATALVQPFVTGAMGEQIGSRYSALDSIAQFDNAQATLRAVVAQRRSLVPAMLP